VKKEGSKRRKERKTEKRGEEKKAWPGLKIRKRV